MSKINKNQIIFQPRSYQLHYLEKAKKQNAIICLGTGAGKTYISIMLLKEYTEQMKNNRMKSIFLCPTIPLVNQQADEISMHTKELFRTKKFCGRLSPNSWNLDKWTSEIESTDVLVLTPDIFFSILSKQFIDIKKICVLIIDECHHGGLKRNKNGRNLTSTNHPYKRIMKFVADKEMVNEIRIIGLTASVVNACYDPVNLSDCIKELQSTYNSRIYGEFDFDPRYLAEPDILTWSYNGQEEVNQEFYDLYSVQTKLKNFIKEVQVDDECTYFNNMLNIQKYEGESPSVKAACVERMIRDLDSIHQELGIYPAYLACLEFKNEFDKSKLLMKNLNSCFLICSTLRYLEFCEKFYSNIINKVIEDDKDPFMELITAKMSRLLDILFLFYEGRSDLSVLVFVDRVLYSYAISKYLERLSNSSFRSKFSFIKPNFFVGSNNEYLNFKFIRESVNNFKNSIREFKEGLFNLLVTTAVLEEGIDIGKCNLVIRFNEAHSYREFVQSKGRARAKDSYFIMMHETWENLDNQIKFFNDTEEFLKVCFKRAKEDELDGPVKLENLKIFETEEKEFFQSSSGSVIFQNESAAFLQRYIQKKGNNSYVPTYSFEEIEQEEEIFYIFTLSLVGVTSLKNEVVGKPHLDQKDAFKSACLAAIKQLYESGQLDEHFIPISAEEVVKNCILIAREYSEEESAELNFVFDKKIPEKFMFKKQINNFDQFKKLIKSTDHNLYEIIFHFEGLQLNENEEKLALLTQFDLDKSYLTTRIQNYLNDATIELKLIKKNVVLNEDQLKKIGQFTLNVFKSAIPVLKRRKDIEFDIEKCLFKFSFINHVDLEIDYDLIDEFINLTIEDERNIQKNEKKLIKTIHTDGIYKLMNFDTILPTDTFYCKTVKHYVDYNQFYERKFKIKIQNQEDPLVQVERVHYHKKEEESDKVYDYLPKELCVITSVSENLDRKLSCLPFLIYKIKQKIFLNKIHLTLNQEIINGSKIEDSIFDYHSTTAKNNIIEYSNNPRFQNEQDQSSESSSSSEEKETDLEDLADNEDEFNKKLDEQFEQLPPKKKEAKRIKEKHTGKFKPINQDDLNKIVPESMEQALKDCNYQKLEDLLNNFCDLFELIVKNDLGVNYEFSESEIQIEVDEKNQQNNSELKSIDFNFWANESSDRFVIRRDKLKEALTIKSASNETNLERLEFLGDTFLKLITCGLLFHHYPNSVVGELDMMKNRFVSNKSLYVVSRRKQLQEYMFGDHKFLPGSNWLPDGLRFTGTDPNKSDNLITLVDSNGETIYKESKLNMIDRNQYTELRPKSISDTIEALIGSVLVSSGIRNACLFMKYVGIYSDKFELSLNSNQKNWFIEGTRKFDPLANDPLGNLAAFAKEMYGKHNLKDLELKIGYEFVNKALLVQAFKHASHNDLITFPSYENLEFLGDSVIDYLIVKYFYDDNAKYSPSELTCLKQSLNNNNFFGALSIKFGLDNYLISKCELLFKLIGTYKAHFNRTLKKSDKLIIPDSYFILNEPETINFNDDVVEVPKILGDIFESLIGAVFIDSDFCLNSVWKVLLQFMSNELIKFKQNVPKTFLKVLQDLYPKAEFSECKIGENSLRFVEIEIDNIIFTGEGRCKKSARTDAAKKVIKHHLKMD